MFPCVRQLSSPSWGPRSRWTAKTCRKCVVSFELLNCSNQCTYIHLYIYICIYNHVYCIRSYDLVWFRMIYVCLISYVWMDACMVWYGMAWHGMVWNGMEWYVMLYMCVIIFRDTMDPPMRAIICAAVAWPAINFDALLHQMWCFLNPKNIYTHTYRVSILYL